MRAFPAEVILAAHDLADVPRDAAVLREEPFGPLLTLSRFGGLSDALDQANATTYGLASYVFTGSEATAAAMTAGLRADSVGVNLLKGVVVDAPNGGIDDSGYGYEGGMESARAFQNLKLVNRYGLNQCPSSNGPK